MIEIFDGNNQARVAWETTSTPVQYLYTQAKVAKPNIHVWVWDGKNGNARRRAIYPGYKSKRQPSPDGFMVAVKRLKDTLACLSNVFQYTVDGYEADDVIATLVKGSTQPIRIHSTDGDFHQLVNERVQCTRPPYDGVPSRHVRIYKSTVGDPRDDIKGIPGFGEKAFAGCNPDGFIGLVEGRLSAEHANVSKRWLDWLSVPENLQLLRDCYQIVGFYDVPNELLTAGRVIGRDNPTRAQELIREGFYVASSVSA